MRDDEFRRYLENQTDKDGNPLTENGINSRMKLCIRVERDYNIDLDSIITDVDKVQLLRRFIYDNEDYTKRQRQNIPNAIKKYFEFVNRYELPRL